MSLAEAATAASATKYDHKAVEGKWQAYWDEHRTFATPVRDPSKPKKYVLDMFPYPSGSGLHVGHPEGYTASDVMARYWRMCGFDVLHPMGWDSFGLPAEQHAIQTGTHPAVTTYKNIAVFKRQLKSLGFSYDWDRELATTDVGFVKWTQWIFLQLFKAGLAEQSQAFVNWCPALGTVLANEEVINGLSERGDHPVVRQPLRQWVLKITQYADKLEQGLEGLQWPEGTLTAQRQWIGRSEGASISFGLADASSLAPADSKIDVFTTRPDTLMGVTYVVLAPEHPLVKQLMSPAQADAVADYVAAAASKSDLDRTAAAGAKAKTGVYLGASAAHPLTGEAVPIWVADYVLGGYGTGAVMAVPGHDERDFAFACAFGLPVKRVVAAAAAEGGAQLEKAFTAYGVAVNSGAGFDGLSTEECKKAVVEALAARGAGQAVTNYRLRDWIFSRQRYWGEPIPIYFPVDMEGDEGGDPREGAPHTIRYDQPFPVPEEELPLTLPEMESFEPGDDPAGCLARAADWRYFQRDGRWFARETNTMPQWAGSCWYYLRFTDPTNAEAAWGHKADADWLPVDLYVGGQEHAVLHLLYARFWHRVLHDLGYAKDPEPFQRLVHQGMILGADNEKMSKSRGNVVNPDDITDAVGADALRLYEMFMGPLEATKPWQTSQVAGVVRFRDRVYALAQRDTLAPGPPADAETLALLHRTMRKVTQDVEALAFNTAIAALMVLSNHLAAQAAPSRDAVEALVLMLSPFAPHVGEECWALLGHEGSIAYAPWVAWDEALCVSNTARMGVQVNGKVRGELELAVDALPEDAQAAALQLEKVAAMAEGREIKKFIYVPGRIINIVLGGPAK